MELRGIEPRTFHMRSEHSTTELQPRVGSRTNEIIVADVLSQAQTALSLY